MSSFILIGVLLNIGGTRYVAQYPVQLDFDMPSKCKKCLCLVFAIAYLALFLTGVGGVVEVFACERRHGRALMVVVRAD